MTEEPSIAVVVVTFNRRRLLENCLNAILAQSHRPTRIFVLDNASTDDTAEWLTNWPPSNTDLVKVISLPENIGGAGGFSQGLRIAIEHGADWVWMMDDDAEPTPQSLFELMQVAQNPNDVYGSLAVYGADTSWATTLVEPVERVVHRSSDVPRIARVMSLPFLGFLIHRDLVKKAGLPDPGYFIAADDVEYCLRAKRCGARLIIAGRSQIKHPKAHAYRIDFLGKSLTYLQLAPWKRYYDTRNRLLIARKYYGVKLWSHSIPGTLARLSIALFLESHKLAQFWAFFAGTIDGLLGIKGRRHTWWHISH